MIRLKLSVLTALLTSVSFLQLPIDNLLFSNEPKPPVNIDNSSQNKITCLCFVSSPGDFIGLGKTKYYSESDGENLKISSRTPSVIRIEFEDLHDDHIWWYLDFAAPKGQILTPGLYKNAERFPGIDNDCPGLSFSGNGRGCNRNGGGFEILELIYGEDGQLESFAANFIQTCENKNRPLYGNIRYNSNISVEPRFVNSDKINSTFIVSSHQEIYPSFPGSIFVKSDEPIFSFQPNYQGRDEIEITVSGKNTESWTFVFSAPFDRTFEEGSYYDVAQFPHMRFSRPAAKITHPQGEFSVTDGFFKIINLKKDSNNEISSLGLDFFLNNDEDQTLCGSIRFNSDIPMDHLINLISENSFLLDEK